MQYSVVEICSGRILYSGECQAEMLGDQARGDGQCVIVGAYEDTTQYVPGLDAVGPVVADVHAEPRPPLPAMVSRATIKADGVDLAVISGLPMPCSFTVDGGAHLTMDGTIEITSLMPASYLIEIDQWPFLPWRTTIEAV